jgi:signal transduction histidine kinase
MLFSIPTVTDHYMKFSFSTEAYAKRYNEILSDVVTKYLLYMLLLVGVSALFAHFALRPLREALRLNDEFVKDMLHDFNTPLSSLKINFKILQKKFGKDDAISRSEEAMQTIHDLQANLAYFLSHSPLAQEKLELFSSLSQRVKSYKVIFPDITFLLEIEEIYLKINPEAFLRVVDNLLSNAAKYNVPHGTVTVRFVKNHLIIEDSGIGIKEPSKVFDRFYKETSRGMGIGLHVVKKLCDDLDIEIKVESKLKKGTKFSLNLEKVMFS